MEEQGEAPPQEEQHLGREEAKKEMSRRQQPVWHENPLLDPAQAQRCFVSVSETCYPLGGRRKNSKGFWLEQFWWSIQGLAG